MPTTSPCPCAPGKLRQQPRCLLQFGLQHLLVQLLPHCRVCAPLQHCCQRCLADVGQHRLLLRQILFLD
jgi:hypothetical protein